MTRLGYRSLMLLAHALASPSDPAPPAAPPEDDAGTEAMARLAAIAERQRRRTAPPPPAGPLARPCPRCGAAIGEECDRRTLIRHEVHGARLKVTP